MSESSDKPVSRSATAAQKRIDALEAKLKRIEEERVKVEQARREQAKKLEKLHEEAATPRAAVNRQKMLIGAMIFEECKRNPKVDGQIKAKLNTWLTRDRDRQAFGLAPLTGGGTTGDGGG